MVDYFFGLLALLGFVLSLTVHVASLFHINVAQYFPFIWWVPHIGIFVVGMPFLLGFRTLFDQTSESSKEEFSDYLMILGMFMFFYIFINLMLFFTYEITAFGWTQPSVVEGKFVLLDNIHHKGKVIREITENEYRLFQTQGLRFASSMWLFFYFVQLAFFLFRKKR